MSQLRKALEKVCGEDLALAGRVDPWPGTHACPSEKKKKKLSRNRKGQVREGKVGSCAAAAMCSVCPQRGHPVLG